MKLFKNNEEEEEETIDYKNVLSPNLVVLMRDFDLLLQDPETNQDITESQYLEELLRLDSNRSNDLNKLNPMKSRICNYF